MKVCLLTVIIVFLSISNVFSQSTLNGNESYYEEDYFLVQHINDINFVVGGSVTNDVAFTSSFLAKAFLNKKEQKNRLVSFGIKSDLYTEREGDYFFIDGRMFYNEYFSEISSAEYSLVKFVKKNLAIQYAGGIGIINKDKPIAGLTLWIQGGKDGTGGFHKLMDKWDGNNGQVNLSRDEITPFVYVSPGISYYFNLNSRLKPLPHTLVSELGLNLCTNFLGNYVYFNHVATAHLLQFPVSKRLFLFDLLGAGDFKFHRDGVKLNARVGLGVSWGRIAFGYEITKQFGNENIEWIDFADNEDLYTIFIKVRLHKQKNSKYWLASKDSRG